MGTAQHMSRTMLKLTLLLAAVSASFALNRSVIATPNAPGAIGPYAQGQLLTLASGERMIHAAGQIGLDPSTGALAPGGITGEAPQAMNNVQAIIESVPGASMADVYECTVLWLTSQNTQHSTWCTPSTFSHHTRRVLRTRSLSCRKRPVSRSNAPRVSKGTNNKTPTGMLLFISKPSFIEKK